MCGRNFCSYQSFFVMLKILKFAELSSTNDYVLHCIREGFSLVEDVLIIANLQSHGRGRLNGRTWVSCLGNFHGTYIINLQNLKIQQNSVSVLNNTILKCIKEILCDIAKKTEMERKISIKNPNDVLINQKKIAGVLIEISYPYAAIGVGMNLKVSPIPSATNICSEFNYELNTEEFGNILYEKFISQLEHAGI